MDLNIKETRIFGRYVTLKHIKSILETYSEITKISVAGFSELDKEIPLVTLGTGSKKILIWSQMHGNESTTTKAILDFLALIDAQKDKSEAIKAFLTSHTLKIIPILNPDGAEAYTRVNSNGVDLNRDAQNLSQKESQTLRAVFDAFNPDLCLNMHGQRTIYGLPSGKAASVSFLAPAGDDSRAITAAREEAMGLIASIYSVLSKEIPGQIGRYDDTFNLNCVGDTFTQLGVPTILFEAGHISGDYNREITRILIFKALLVVFNISEEKTDTKKTYFDIPENLKSHCDIILKNVRLSPEESQQNIAIQYKEVLNEGKIVFLPQVLEFNSILLGHKVIECNGDHIIFNNSKSVSLNENVYNLCNKTNDINISLNI